MTEVSYGDGEALIGQSVIKRFSRKKYMGHIVAYDPNTKWYKVSFALTPDPCITSLLKIQVNLKILFQTPHAKK